MRRRAEDKRCRFWRGRFWAGFAPFFLVPYTLYPLFCVHKFARNLRYGYWRGWGWHGTLPRVRGLRIEAGDGQKKVE